MPHTWLMVVFGATGAQGGSVVNAFLQDHAYKVRAVTRDASSEKAEELRSRGCEVVQADLDDAASVRLAVEGAYACFGVTNFWVDTKDPPREVQQGKNLVDAVKAAGVKHFVFSGFEYVQKIIGIECPHFDAKGKVEEYMQESGVPFTGIRLSFYYQNFLTYFLPRKVDEGKYVLEIPMGHSLLNAIDVNDVGGCVHAILDKPKDYLGRFVGLSGDAMTVGHCAEIFSKVFAPNIITDGKMTTDTMMKKSRRIGAIDLAVMFEFYQRGQPDRDSVLTRKLNPKTSSFEAWLRANKEKFCEEVFR